MRLVDFRLRDRQVFLGIRITAAAEDLPGFSAAHEVPEPMSFERELQSVLQQQVVERRSAPFSCKGRIVGLHAESPRADLIEIAVSLVLIAVRAYDQLRCDQQGLGIAPYAIVVTEIHLRSVARILVMAVGASQILAVEVARVVVAGRVGRFGVLLPVFGEVQDRGIAARVVTLIGIIERLLDGFKTIAARIPFRA